jgi:hypothetical protein
MIINLPKSWDEVYVDQFIALRELDLEMSFYERYVHILSILTDTDSTDEMWDDIDTEQLNNYIKQLKWLSLEPTSSPKLKIDDLTAINVNSIKFGEFIDLEHYFQDYYANLTTIAAIFFRKTKADDWGEIVFQKHGTYSIEMRADELERQPITSIYWLISTYLKWKDSIMIAYETIFEPKITDFDEADLDEEDIEAEEVEKSMKKWSWESVIHKLANDNVINYDNITDLPLIFVLNNLSFRKDMKLD